MPSAPLHYCAEPGCSAKVAEARCPAHRAGNRADQRRYQTGATAYNSARWVRFSTAFRAEHPFCVNADKRLPHCTLVTEVTDHVRPHRGDERIFWAGPFQPMCRACHSIKTAQETGFGG